jgi:hypothetical protein
MRKQQVLLWDRRVGGVAPALAARGSRGGSAVAEKAPEVRVSHVEEIITEWQTVKEKKSS